MGTRCIEISSPPRRFLGGELVLVTIRSCSAARRGGRSVRREARSELAHGRTDRVEHVSRRLAFLQKQRSDSSCPSQHTADQPAGRRPDRIVRVLCRRLWSAWVRNDGAPQQKTSRSMKKRRVVVNLAVPRRHILRGFTRSILCRTATHFHFTAHAPQHVKHLLDHFSQ